MKLSPAPSFSPEASSAELSLGAPEHLPIEQLDLFFEQNPKLIEEIKRAETQTLGRAINAGYDTTLNTRSIAGARISNIKRDASSHIERLEDNKRFAELLIPTVIAERPEDKYRDRRYDPPLRLPRVSLIFSTDEHFGYKGVAKFINPDDVSFEGIFMGYADCPQRIPLREVVGLKNPEGSSMMGAVVRRGESTSMMGAVVRRGESTQHLPPGGVVELSELGIIVRNDAYEALSDLLHRPVAECRDAINTLVTLGEEQHLDPQLIETLSKTVSDYATYRKPEPVTPEECYDETGQCLVRSHDFKEFCKEWAGINMAIGHYSSSRVSEYADFHAVNVFGDIVIDWTARQFTSDTPYPYIYRRGDTSAWNNELSAVHD